MIAEIPVRVTGYGPAPTEGLVRVDRLAPARRITRAVLAFGILFSLALVSVFIPVAHLLLVPILLVAAFVTLIVRIGATALVLGARATCPDCGKEQELDLPGNWQLPADVTCRGCQRRLTLTAAPAPER